MSNPKNPDSNPLDELDQISEGNNPEQGQGDAEHKPVADDSDSVTRHYDNDQDSSDSKDA